MTNTSFISNDNIFSGYVMLKLEPRNYNWLEWIANLTRAHKDIIKEPEFECHITIASKIHKDDVVNFDKRISPAINLCDVIKAEQEATYFDNNLSVAKFDVKDSVSLSTLFHYRNEVFCHCRCLETYPNFHPHITIAYLYKNCRLPLYTKKEFLNEFIIKGITFSIHDEKDNMITW